MGKKRFVFSTRRGVKSINAMTVGHVHIWTVDAETSKDARKHLKKGLKWYLVDTRRAAG